MPAADAADMLATLSALRGDLLSAGAGLRSWAEWAGFAGGIWERWIGLPEDPEEEEARVWRSLRLELESLSTLEPLGPVSWDFFLETLEEKLRASRLEPSPRRGVRVLGAMDCRGESFRALFLLGLEEGQFPRRVLEDPILSDKDRALLRHPAGYWISPKAAGYDEERLLFALTAASARERLYASWCRTEEDGRARSPSLYLRELCRAAGRDLAAAERLPRQPLERLRSLPPELLSGSEAAIRALLEGSAPAPEHLRALNAGGGKAGPMDGIVGPLAGGARPLSPTALDRFSGCPFRFFAAAVLGLREPEDEPEPGRIAPRVKGRMYHEILERFYRGLAESGFWGRWSGKHSAPLTENSPPRRGGEFPTPSLGGRASVPLEGDLSSRRSGCSWESRLSSAAAGVFAERDWRELGVYPLVWKAERAVMERNLLRFVRRDMERIGRDGLVPSLFEVELQGELSSHEGKRGADGAEFRGRADRVDLDRAGGRYRVVDYKLSSRGWGGRGLEGLVLSGRMHQPPLYAELVRAKLPPGPSWRLEEFCCCALEGIGAGGEPVWAYPGQAWLRDRDRVLAAVARERGLIREGWFPIRPEDGEFGRCRRCPFPAVCRKSHGRSRARAEAEYDASPLRKIHECGPA